MFKIGEFAKLTQLSTHTLRHYDRVGLLTPCHIDYQTGYRFYSVQQLPRLNRIVVLRDLGFSLEQIARLLEDNIALDEIKGMLRLKEAQVEQQIVDEQNRLARIRTRINQIQHEGEIQTFQDVVVKSIDAQCYMSSGEIKEQDGTIVKLFSEIDAALLSRHIHTTRMGTVVIHGPSDEDNNHHIEIGFPVEQNAPKTIYLHSGWVISLRDLPAHPEVATVIYEGPRSDIAQAYTAISHWMEMNQYVPYTYFREVYLQAGTTATDPNNMVELQIPIKPTEVIGETDS